jgi:prepilin-type N-terminal cleavage/methylation domain-containing protein
MTALKRGFTLIELLIVIAILGVLAVVVLVAINPVQQLARTRDSGRISTTAQIGRSLQAYSASNPNGTYPDETNWATDLLDSEMSTWPGYVNNSLTSDCTQNNYNSDGWCYLGKSATDPEDAIVYSALEADANLQGLCGGTTAWAVYDTSQGRGGVVCGLEPTGPGVTFVN